MGERKSRKMENNLRKPVTSLLTLCFASSFTTTGLPDETPQASGSSFFSLISPMAVVPACWPSICRNFLINTLDKTCKTLALGICSRDRNAKIQTGKAGIYGLAGSLATVWTSAFCKDWEKSFLRARQTRTDSILCRPKIMNYKYHPAPLPVKGETHLTPTCPEGLLMELCPWFWSVQ